MKSSIKFSMVKVENLVPYVNNSRTHSDKQVAQIAASIQEFGFTNPVLIDEKNTLIAGHGRVLAARKLRLNDIPAMVVAGLSESQRKALVLADNRLALSAGWDAEMLKLEMQALMDDGYDMTLTGFDEDEISKFLADEGSEGLTDADEVPEVPEEPVAKLGDTWILGKHRIRCGDSTSATDVEALLAGVSPHLMVTDPPYGVNYDPMWREGHDGGKKENRRKGIVQNDDRADWTEVWALFPGDVAYVWHGGLHSATVADSLAKAGFVMRSQIIWVKQQFVFSRGDYHWQHEPCWYAVRESKKGHYAGDRKQSTVWEISNLNKVGGGKQKNEDAHTDHSTQKPVERMRKPIENNSSPGQAVYEPFSGSGTTIIAAEMTGRVCYAMELNPVYAHMAIKRWCDFTGKDALRDGDKQSFLKLCAKPNGELENGKDTRIAKKEKARKTANIN